MIDGGIECGPNAVLAFAREGYKKLKVNPNELIESLTYPGFIKLASKYWKTGLGEIWRSFSKKAFVKALSKLVPEIKTEHLKTAPAGVRAQAVSLDGSMVDDFYFSRNGVNSEKWTFAFLLWNRPLKPSNLSFRHSSKIRNHKQS